LEPVFEVKASLGIAESGGMDEVANAASKGAKSLAEKKAGLHFAGLRFEVFPIWSDHHWLKGSSKILHPPRSPSGLVAEKLPLYMCILIVQALAPVSSHASLMVIVPFISAPPFVFGF
jgi:hypothetical protein